METKKKIVILISVLIGAAFLYFGFSGMMQKKAEAEKAAVVENAMVETGSAATSSDGLDNLE